MSRKIGVSSAEFSITHCSRRNSGQAKSITYARKPAKIALLLFKLSMNGHSREISAFEIRSLCIHTVDTRTAEITFHEISTFRVRILQAGSLNMAASKAYAHQISVA